MTCSGRCYRRRSKLPLGFSHMPLLHRANIISVIAADAPITPLLGSGAACSIVKVPPAFAAGVVGTIAAMPSCAFARKEPKNKRLNNPPDWSGPNLATPAFQLLPNVHDEIPIRSWNSPASVWGTPHVSNPARNGRVKSKVIPSQITVNDVNVEVEPSYVKPPETGAIPEPVLKLILYVKPHEPA